MITSIKILKDNYIWFLTNKFKKCIIIDPGCADSVLKEIKEKNWYPVALLITHKHKDHTDGIKKLLYYYPNLKVLGPSESKTKGTNIIVSEISDTINILKYKIKILDTPGHTLNHISYYIKPYLFCGDTLFSGGCGRVYKNNYHLMYHSLQKIASLSDDTLICCGHEYTLQNILFLKYIFPKDQDLKNYFKNVIKLIKLKKNTLPTSLKQEKKINYFLKTNNINCQMLIDCKQKFIYPWDFFRYLRILKNNFI